jgi:uncharacterized protein (DUF1015 family)
MTVVRPFRAVHYDNERVDLSRVIVPPYDVIAPDERAAFFDRDPHNAIRFELTRDVKDEANADYSDVANIFASWLESGVLVRDDAPAYYVMKQTFAVSDGSTLERVGFFAELGLADYDERVVLPHERTLAGPKADRLKLLRAARANLSSVFLLYEDEANETAELLASAFADEAALLGHAKDDGGVEYALARLSAPESIARLQAFLAKRPCVIADGHHRYETALEYRNEQREAAGASGAADAPYESTLAYFANAHAPGSLLRPIHRVICEVPAPGDVDWAARLPGWSCDRVRLTGVDAVADTLKKHLEPLADQAAFAADDGSGLLRVFRRATPLGDALMVRILEEEVIGSVFGLDTQAIREGAVSFPKSAERAAREVREGHGTVALYLNPLSPKEVFRVTRQGAVMPQKSTYFHPKVPTGMVFRVHGDA